MPQYRYSPLCSDSIRLLRLMPNEDDAAPIQCQFFTYPLQKSNKGTHPYEALSCVWGSSDKPRFISIDEGDLPITANLYAALLRLRDHFLARIIWVDSICINQVDDQEKEHQIQSMAKIYGQANCVIVWLGEAADDSNQALEDIRIAAEDMSTNSETSHKAILKLLGRPWFRRIWVLQEVAVARHILVACGPREIDWYALCSGLNKLKLSYEAYPGLQSLIRSVTYLIRGATFRSKCPASSLDDVSLGELIDMYYTHEATRRHDKVYALLGMGSDDPSAAGLLPNYAVSWKELLQRLIAYLLPKEVSVEAEDEREMALIKSKGCIVGRVSSVANDSARYDQQHVEVNFYNTPTRSWARRTLQASAKSIQQVTSSAFCKGLQSQQSLEHARIILLL